MQVAVKKTTEKQLHAGEDDFYVTGAQTDNTAAILSDGVKTFFRERHLPRHTCQEKT